MDVKTPNVLLGRTYIAKLADVGLAKFLHKDYLSAAKSGGTFAWSVRAAPPPSTPRICGPQPPLETSLARPV